MVDPDGPADELADRHAGVPGEVARAAADRLVFFTDAVVAIAITLLAIDLPVPTGTGTGALLASLADDGLAYVSFLISFVVIGAHWRGHHGVFRYLAAVDATFVHLTFAWLLVIIATPFLTTVLREGELDVVRFGLYAVAQALLLLVFGAMQALAARRGLFLPGTPPEVTRTSWPAQLSTAGGFLVSVPLFPLIGSWAFGLWAAVPFAVQSVPALVRRGRRRSGT